MLHYMCKSKIHMATVTQADLNYEGSITIDAQLMEAAGIMTYERIQVLNVNNGHRIETYVIPGKAGSGVICLNGATARAGQPGDKVILITYGLMNDEEALNCRPKIVFVDGRNRLRRIKRLPT